MKNSNIVNFQEYTTCKKYYNIGLVLGVIRAGLENGTISLEKIYTILPERELSIVREECTKIGGAY